jgi:hypothetical protein
MIMAWLLMILGILAWNRLLYIPPETSFIVFGAGFDRLMTALAAPRDGK